MKTFYILLFVLCIISCKQNKEAPTTQFLSDEVISLKYEVCCLNDSVIADSVWKLMFVYPEIEQLVMDGDDSLLVFTLNSSFENVAKLEEEIESRGARIIKKLN